MKMRILRAHWITLFVVVAGMLQSNVAQAAQTVTVVPDHTAVTSPVSLTGGEFESPVYADHQYGSKVGADWAFQLLHAPLSNPAAERGSGVANDASSTIAATDGTPQGSQAAFVHGLGRATQDRIFLYPPGTNRLQFDAAQRVRSFPQTTVTSDLLAATLGRATNEST